jgi:hypothetical protein
MATTEEIERRVQQADAARCAARAAAARQVGELAGRRAVLAEQLDEIERELGDVLAAVQDLMDVDELAAFTNLSAADLTRWRDARARRKTARPTRKRPAKAGDSGGGRSARTTAPAPAVSTAAESHTSSVAEDKAVRVPADVA